MSKLARNWNASLRLKINKEKNKKPKGKTSKKPDKEWNTDGHIPDALVEILFPIMKTWKIHSTKAIIVEKNRAASEEITNFFDQKSVNFLEKR